MNKKITNRYKQIYKLVTSLVLAILVSINAAQPATGKEINVIFGETQIENRFPEGISFSVKIELIKTKGAHINLWYRLGTGTWQQESPNCTVKITDANNDSKYFNCVILLDLSGLPPQTLLTYKWELADPNDNAIKFSDEFTIVYSDPQFVWQNLTEGNLSIWWHDRPVEFAEQILSTAESALQRQSVFYGVKLEHPIQLVVQNSQSEFQNWSTLESQSVGGQAFPWLGTTIQIIELDMPDFLIKSWLKEVVPHEISHLYFFQVSARYKGNPPKWLDEGMAGYNEIKDLNEDWSFVRQAIQQDKLIPLGKLRSEFPENDKDFRLAYAESTTAIIYIIETYGQDGLKKLFSAYQAGENSDAAFMQAFGRNLDDFEKDWQAWVVTQQRTPDNFVAIVFLIFTILSVTCSCSALVIVILLITIFNKKIKIQPVK